LIPAASPYNSINKEKPERSICEFKNGRRDVWNHVCESFSTSLFNFAVRIVEDIEESKDIVNDSFRKLWLLRDRFDSLINIRAFLYITTRNACFDYLRHIKYELNSKKTFLQVVDVSQDCLLDEMCKRELHHQLYSVMESLPEIEKTVLVKIFCDGLSTSEISLQLNRPVQNIRNIKTRAINRLRTCISEGKIVI
jgi:RNA polymerase sigma factor (sigma-70 family)